MCSAGAAVRAEGTLKVSGFKPVEVKGSDKYMITHGGKLVKTG
jgi:hypothetical protein